MEYYKTIKLRINANKSDMKRLSDCNLESAFVWNECIKKNLEMYNDKKKLLNKKELQDFVKDLHCDNICASNKQIVSQKVFEAFRSISLARKAGRTDLRYPYKQKKFFQTEWSYQFMRFMYDSNSILLTTARYIDKDGNARNGKQIKLKFKATLPQNIKTLKLIYEHGHYYACISYIVEVEEKKSYFDNKASIDLGEIHAITTTDNNQNQLIITGRKIRSIKQFRNKKQAELRSKMDKCKKGSRKWKRYKRAWQYIRLAFIQIGL